MLCSARCAAERKKKRDLLHGDEVDGFKKGTGPTYSEPRICMTHS